MQRARTGTRRKQEEVKEPPVVEEKLPPIKSPYDRLEEEVWSIADVRKQRELIGEIFSLRDGPGLCVEALLLDEAFQALSFAHRIKLNKPQTKGFFELFLDIWRRLAADPVHSLDDIFAFYKAQIFRMCPLTLKVFGDLLPVCRPLEPAPGSESSPLSPSPSQSLLLPAAAAERLPSASSPASPAARAAQPRRKEAAPLSPGPAARPLTPSPPAADAQSAATARSARPHEPAAGAASDPHEEPAPRTQRSARRRALPEAAAAPAQEAQADPPAEQPEEPSGDLAEEHVYLITEYLTQTLFANFSLYQAVFNPKVFAPRKLPVEQEVLIETPLPDIMHLNLSDGVFVPEELPPAAAEVAGESTSSS